MSNVSSTAASLVAMQAEARQQAMATIAVKQNAGAEQAVADMLLAAAQQTQETVAAAPPGQGLFVDLRA